MSFEGFGSFFLGGFESATHRRRRDRRRLDVIAATGHDTRAAEDYALLKAHGIRAARDALRWHLIERRAGRYDWSSLLPQLHAARDAGLRIAWDLSHYGWPSGLDIWSPGFVTRFAAFAGAAARLIAAESPHGAIYTPVNEISFWAWAGGDTGGISPFARGRGGELKRQLARAALAAIAAIRDADPRASIATAEPLILVHPRSAKPADIAAAAGYTGFQFEALDMLLGRAAPELGGHPGAVDLLGLNYYFNNQWVDRVGMVALGDARHRPLSELLEQVAVRYPGYPLYIAETGTEGVFRPYWLRYVADQVAWARGQGAPVEGICLYPVMGHPGWDDDRHCPNGLFDGFTPAYPRTIHAATAAELAALVARFDAAPSERS